MGLFSRNASDGDGVQEHWLLQGEAGEVVFDGAKFVEDYVVLRWDTDRGGVGLVHSLAGGNANCHMVIRALRRHYGERLDDRYACLAVAQTGTQVVDPYVPRLLAYDIGVPGKEYETTWAQ